MVDCLFTPRPAGDRVRECISVVAGARPARDIGSSAARAQHVRPFTRPTGSMSGRVMHVQEVSTGAAR